MGTVIQVENLSKSYLIGHQSREPYLALRDVMVETMKNAGRRILHPMRAGSRGNSVEEIWALKDVSFEVKQGDRLGIIGRNGAGKSTLLKILSRITEPTRGRVRIKGRVGSLLEVGTGFHPELTGRENIFLNGAILGMTRMEIRRKFDEIVDFAEIEKFLDTPVKRYSSGMYVRLAFAVAANMEPENLVVDEVLAVGDHRFQQKCLDKMEHFGKEGRTILFVSHNMTAIEQLCRSCMLIETGQIKRIDSDIRSIIRIYLFGLKEKADTCRWNNTGPVYDNPWFIPNTFSIVNRDGEIMSMPVRNDEEVWVQIEGEVRQLDPALTIGYAVFTKDGTQLYWSYHTDQEPAKWPKLGIGPIKLRSRIPTRFLNEGSYRIELIGGLHFRQWLFEPGVNAPAIFLSIQGGLSDSPYWMVQRPGLIAPLLEWSLVV